MISRSYTTPLGPDWEMSCRKGHNVLAGASMRSVFTSYHKTYVQEMLYPYQKQQRATFTAPLEEASSHIAQCVSCFYVWLWMLLLPEALSRILTLKASSIITDWHPNGLYPECTFLALAQYFSMSNIKSGSKHVSFQAFSFFTRNINQLKIPKCLRFRASTENRSPYYREIMMCALVSER